MAGPPTSPDVPEISFGNNDDDNSNDDEAAVAALVALASSNSHPYAPTSAASMMGFESIGGTCHWTCHRYLVIQQSCAGPFEVVTIPTAFSVTLLHSNPRPLVAVTRLLHLHLHPPTMAKKKHNNNTSPLLHHHRSNPTSPAPSSSSLVSSLIRPVDRPALEQVMEHLVDWREQILVHFSCSILSPLHEQAGVLCITGDRLYFSPSPLELVVTVPAAREGGGEEDGGTTTADPTVDYRIRLAGASSSSSSPWARVGKWNTSNLVAYARRYHGLRDTAVELYFANSSDATRRSGMSSSSLSSSSSSVTGRHSSHHSVLIALRRRHDRELVIRHLDAAASLSPCASADNPSSTNGSNNKKNASLICFTSRDFVARAFQEWQKVRKSEKGRRVLLVVVVVVVAASECSLSKPGLAIAKTLATSLLFLFLFTGIIVELRLLACPQLGRRPDLPRLVSLPRLSVGDQRL
jgi:hypothetical protein